MFSKFSLIIGNNRLEVVVNGTIIVVKYFNHGRLEIFQPILWLIFLEWNYIDFTKCLA